MWPGAREQTQLSTFLIPKPLFKELKYNFKGYFLSTVQENQYAKLKKRNLQKKQDAHMQVSLFYSHMHKHEQNYYWRKDNGKQYPVTQKQQCFSFEFCISFFFFLGYDIILYKQYIKKCYSFNLWSICKTSTWAFYWELRQIFKLLHKWLRLQGKPRLL